MPGNDEVEFQKIMANNGMANEPDCERQGPYGLPLQRRRSLTRRGRVALIAGAAVICSGGAVCFQVDSSNERKAQEIELKAERLKLEKMREENRARENNRKVSTAAEKDRQTHVDTCVKGNARKVGKGYGAPSMRQVVEDCQAQYASSSDGSDMGAAGSSTDTGSSSLQLPVNGTLVTIAAGALGLYAITRRHTKRDRA
ncbi:hypothetical protein ACIG3E_33010 [Streptomyces sp. NPDC053474]|uniref:hypothetical protein n=1 Tax=Streptomyces sp. NPDC053474 TaxID=3365704 RepID=UPI0037D6DCDC